MCERAHSSKWGRSFKTGGGEIVDFTAVLSSNKLRKKTRGDGSKLREKRVVMNANTTTSLIDLMSTPS